MSYRSKVYLRSSDCTDAESLTTNLFIFFLTRIQSINLSISSFLSSCTICFHFVCIPSFLGIMYTKFLALSLLPSSVFGADFSQIVSHDFGAMLKRGESLAKRQGYYPTSKPCGSGATCAEACGAGQVECPADAGRGVCFDPSQSRCCPDGSGCMYIALVHPSTAYLTEELTSAQTRATTDTSALLTARKTPTAAPTAWISVPARKHTPSPSR